MCRTSTIPQWESDDTVHSVLSVQQQFCEKYLVPGCTRAYDIEKAVANRSLIRDCYGFAWQGFGSGEAIGVASVRSCEKLPPCLIKPVLADSKVDLPLAKFKPISNGGSTSGIA